MSITGLKKRDGLGSHVYALISVVCIAYLCKVQLHSFIVQPGIVDGCGFLANSQINYTYLLGDPSQLY